MEYNFYPLIEDKLKELYGLPDENTNYLMKYLRIRTAIHLNRKNVKDKDIFKFIIEELGFPILNDGIFNYIKFEGQEYKIIHLSEDVMEQFNFRAEFEGDLEYKQIMHEIFQIGYRKAQKYKKSNNYPLHLEYERLMAANEEFGVHSSEIEPIEGFYYESKKTSKKPLEETILKKINSNNIDNSTSYISEEDLENYLSKRLDKIEKGLKIIGTQVPVGAGEIDIFAKDKNGQYCVIELKIKEDKKLIWQSIHYPLEVKKMFNCDSVRMIVIAPEFKKHIIDALTSSGNVEMFEYEIEVEDREIISLDLNKLN